MKKIIILSFLLLIFTNNLHAVEKPQITLTLSHFLSPKSLTHARFLVPWAKKIEQQSDGRIKIEIYPSMTLGGKPPELYSQLRDGVADMVWTITGYTPGVFPRSEVFELATVHRNSAQSTNLAIQDVFPLIADDFKHIHPLLVHVHAGNALHLVNECIKNAKELQGLKLRTPSRSGGWMINSWGSEPVGMPVPSLSNALAKKVIDGALIPFEIVPPLKIHQLTSCSITGYDDMRFGTSVFLFAMNKYSYRKLPKDLKTIIDNNSGIAIAKQVGQLWDNVEHSGKELQRQSGSPTIELSQKQSDNIFNLSKRAEKRWVKENLQRSINAKKLLTQARKAVQKHTN